MAYKTDFLSQWNNVITAIKVEMNKQFDYFGKIKLEKLNEAYNLQAQKWSSRIMYEGNWLANMEKEEFSKEFLYVLSSFKFSEVTVSGKRSALGYLMSALIGVGLFFPIKYALHVTMIGSLAISVIVLILGIILSSGSEKRKLNEEKENTKTEYVEQLKTIENTLAAICEKYDN